MLSSPLQLSLQVRDFHDPVSGGSTGPFSFGEMAWRHAVAAGIVLCSLCCNGPCLSHVTICDVLWKECLPSAILVCCQALSNAMKACGGESQFIENPTQAECIGQRVVPP